MKESITHTIHALNGESYKVDIWVEYDEEAYEYPDAEVVAVYYQGNLVPDKVWRFYADKMLESFRKYVRSISEYDMAFANGGEYS